MDEVIAGKLGLLNMQGDFGPDDDDDEGWIDVDGGPPELEDMSEHITAARRMRCVSYQKPMVALMPSGFNLSDSFCAFRAM